MTTREVVVPYKESGQSKKEQVAGMFDKIAGTYDFLNHFLSLGIDVQWRKKVVSELQDVTHDEILDVATGTADLAIALASLKPGKIIGVDIAEKMLKVGSKKLEKKGLNELISLEYGDSENLPFESNSFDAVTVSFGVRNFENLDKGIAEINRVLKPNGKTVILEFSHPEAFPFKQLYNLYFLNVLPLFGRMFSNDKTAYSYLPESVKAFPSGDKFLGHLKIAGFKNTKCKKLTLGICSIYTGIK